MRNHEEGQDDRTKGMTGMRERMWLLFFERRARTEIG